MNNDGKTDIILGAPGFNNFQGSSYIIFGKANWEPAFNVTDLTGENGFKLLGLNVGDLLGCSVGAVGDINADGISDVGIVAPGVEGGRGAGYVIFGKANWNASFVDLANLNNTTGFIISGVNLNLSFCFTNDALCKSIGRAGDLNGDGIDDLVLGVSGVNNTTGAAYVIFGKFPLRSGNNTLVVKQGHSAIITSDELSAIDLNGFSQALTFIINNVQGGQFQWRNGSQPVEVFIQQAITDGNIQFVQDGSPQGVSYEVRVTNGAVSLPYQPANVTFILTQPFVYRPFPDQTIIVNQPFSWVLPSDTFRSPENETLTFTLQQTNGSALPDWLDFDASTQQVTGTAPSIGVSRLSFFARDNYNLSAHTDFDVLAIPGSEPPSNHNILTGVGIGGAIVGGLGLFVALGYGIYKKCCWKRDDTSSHPTPSSPLINKTAG